MKIEDFAPEEEMPIDQSEAADTEGDVLVEDDAPNYADVIEKDLEELRSEFGELCDLKDILELRDPMRYAALRDMGLTPKEAYLATEGRRRRADNRSHLKSSVPRGAQSPRAEMTRAELEIAKELFFGLSDSEIRRLYKKVQ